MKATTSRQFSSAASLVLKVVGTVLILSSIVDFLVILIPLDLVNRGWQINVTSQLVERGIVPMVGMALIFISAWMDAATEGGQKPTKPLTNLRFWVAILASLLGLFYLLLFPLHLNNTRIARSQAITQIGQQAQQAETQLNTQLSSDQFQQQIEQRKTLLRNQFSSLIQNETALNEALGRQDLPQQVKQVLEASKTNPRAIDEFLEQQADSLPTQLLTQIRDRKQELEEQAKTQSLKSSLQTGISSLLLAIGYITVGAVGLKGLGLVRRGKRKPSGV